MLRLVIPHTLWILASLAVAPAPRTALTGREPIWHRDLGDKRTRHGFGERQLPNVLQLTDNAASDYEASWSPDGSQIAYNSNLDGDYEICVMLEDGTNVVQVTDNAADDVSPVLAPSASPPPVWTVAVLVENAGTQADAETLTLGQAAGADGAAPPPSFASDTTSSCSPSTPSTTVSPHLLPSPVTPSTCAEIGSCT